MRCPHCAGEILEDSRFCGICGQPVADALGTLDVPPARFVPASPHPRRSAGAMVAAGTMSLFELPISRGARIARVALILVVDLALLGTGIAMIASYLGDRERATRSAPAEVEAPAAAPSGLAPSSGAVGEGSAAEADPPDPGRTAGPPQEKSIKTGGSTHDATRSRGRGGADGPRGAAGGDRAQEETAAGDAGTAARPSPSEATVP